MLWGHLWSGSKKLGHQFVLAKCKLSSPFIYLYFGKKRSFLSQIMSVNRIVNANCRSAEQWYIHQVPDLSYGHIFLFSDSLTHELFSKKPANIIITRCIPVGCVPPACYPYLPACTALGGTCWGCTCLGDVPGPGRVYLPGGVPGSGGCTCVGGTCPSTPPCEQNDKQV